MGLGDKIPVQTQEELVNKRLAPLDLSIDKIKAEGGIHIQPGKSPYGEMDLEVLFVITSYSIHYTKLYERRSSTPTSAAMA